jgi:hypothetical protein
MRFGSPPVGVLGNQSNPFPVVLVAGVGGGVAFACLLVIGIVLILRSRRQFARATDPSTPLNG